MHMVKIMVYLVMMMMMMMIMKMKLMLVKMMTRHLLLRMYLDCIHNDIINPYKIKINT